MRSVTQHGFHLSWYPLYGNEHLWGWLDVTVSEYAITVLVYGWRVPDDAVIDRQYWQFP